MDGQAVNWALFKTLSNERDNQQLPKLVNIGNCNLHVLQKRSRNNRLEVEKIAQTLELYILQC